MRKVAFSLLWLYVFTLPWDYALQFGEPIGSAGRVAGLLALAGWLVLVTTRARMRRVQAFHISTVCCLSIITLSLFWTVDAQVSPSCGPRIYPSHDDRLGDMGSWGSTGATFVIWLWPT